jgi:hypothetical protein
MRIAVATPDTLTARMAGPAIRAWQVANALSADGHDVRLVTTTVADLPGAPFPVEAVDDGGLADVERWCDVLVFQGWLVHKRPFLLESEKVLVADIYDPLISNSWSRAATRGGAAGWPPSSRRPRC